MSSGTGKRSRATLRAFLADDDNGSAVVAADDRAAELGGLATDDPTILVAIRDVFAGTGLPEDRDKVRRLLRTRAEIQQEWGNARNSFLAIGRALLALENDLTKVEFARLRQGTERLFPFSDATATQLRQIARAVDGGRIPAESCPGSYGTAYQITLLSDTQLRAAQARGLIRVDVTRREIMQLRREIAVDDCNPAPAGRLNRSRLREEHRRLAERRKRLADELTLVDQRLRQLEQLLLPAIESGVEDGERRGL